MKKSYILTLALLLSFIGYAQVQNQPNMVRLDFGQEELDYTTYDWQTDWGNNVAHWMETTDDNCLALVVNNPWSDGMVLYSYDDGETWERKLFYQHPGVNNVFFYPRWTSCVWGNNGELRVAYEFNCSTGEPNALDPAIGGVAFWSESLPYQGSGEPFVMEFSNLTGQTVMTQEGRIGANTLDISNLSSGIYFVSAGNDTQKLVVR